MSDQDRKSRIRWTAQERQAVAASMTRLLNATPKLTKLQAVTHAQTVLPPSRRRAIQSWASVQALLQPFMKGKSAVAVDDATPEDAVPDDTTPDDANDAAPQAGGRRTETEAETADETGAVVDTASGSGSPMPAPARSTDDEPPAPTQAGPVAVAPAAGSVSTNRAPAAGIAAPSAAAGVQAMAASLAVPLAAMLDGLSTALGDLLARSASDALLRAVQSPAFAEALSRQMGEAMSAAIARLPTATTESVPTAGDDAAQAATPTPPARPAPRPRVLIAGLLPGHADELRTEFGTIIDLRFWRPGESREQLKSAARGCAVAVVIADAVDASVEGELRGLMMRPIRHTGNLPQLKTRLHELIEHNLFGMLGS